MAALTAIYQTGRQTYVSQAWAKIRYSIEFLNTSPGHCVAVRAKNVHFYMFTLNEMKICFFLLNLGLSLQIYRCLKFRSRPHYNQYG